MRIIRNQLRTARRSATRHALAADRAGFAAHEQVLTEIVLTRAAPVLHVTTFSQTREGREGADWLWWWRSSDQWFGVLVQAKRNKPGSRAPWYDFGYRSPHQVQRQVDLLLATAARLRVPAAYVLYNHPPVPRGAWLGPECCASPSESWRTRQRITVLPALIARDVIGREDVAAHFARPLECLLCGGLKPRPLSSLRGSFVDATFGRFLTAPHLPVAPLVARGLLAQAESYAGAQLRTQPDGVSSDRRDLSDLVFPELTDDAGHDGVRYLRHVLDGLRTRPPRYVEAALAGVPFEELDAQALEGIEGLVIVDATRGGTS